MKCSFCGKELTEGAEFCPECGMILSIGGVSEEPEVDAVAEEAVEVPEYTPNVFKAMDFEEEPVQPAMELEANDTEEIAVVVEAVPEYVSEEEESAEAGEADEEIQQEAEIEEAYVAPEYDPTAKVSAEFMQQVADEEPEAEESEEDSEEGEDQEAGYAAEEFAAGQETSYEDIAQEYAPPEYEGGACEVSLPEDAAQEEDTFEDISSGASEESYPVYSAEPEEGIPEEKFTEDENLFAALFEEADSEKIEDITPVDEKSEKAPKKSFAGVAVLLIVLVCVVIAGGYVFKNVLPKIVDTSKTTTAATEEKVNGTVKPEDKTTTKADKTTTEKDTTEKTTGESTTNDKTSTTEPTTEASTTETTTEKETTTKAPEKTTEPATENEEVSVVEPSSYNVDEVAFFPIAGDISIKAGPSASSADVIMHPYGYPVYAYAKEGSYYYVDSPILDMMGWVSEKDLEEYVEEPTAEPTTAAPEEEEAPAGDGEVSYTAVISSAEGLNFRTGPGSDYEVKYTVPGGYRVRVSKESSENPGWVYVTIEDSRYPYGSPSGWVSSEFLS